MSRHRIGAVILVEPTGTVEGGVVLDAVVSRELLVAIFTPEHVNQIHRGAVVIRGHRVERAGVPISWTEVVKRAVELGAGFAIEIDEDDGEIKVAERAGCVVVVADELTELLHRRAG